MSGSYSFAADPIERVIEYVASADPPFRNSIRGASEAEITTLRQLTRRPLPAIYDSFLRNMGHGMDWIALYGGDFDIGGVISFYERAVWVVPPRHWLIALPRSESSYEIYLRQEESGAVRVVSFPVPVAGEIDEDSVEYLGGSLEELIGRAAFSILSMAVAPFSTRLYHADQGFGAAHMVQELAERLGMSPEWFSNDWTAVCKGPGASLVATKPPHRNLVVDCAAGSEEAHTRVVHWLERELGMERAAAIPF